MTIADEYEKNCGKALKFLEGLTEIWDIYV